MIRLAVTPGEPAGIGPDILVQVAQKPQHCELVAFADPDLLVSRAKILGLPLRLRKPSGKSLAPGELAIHPVPMAAPVVAGQLNPANGPYVLNCLTAAVEACQNHRPDSQMAALVTGPVNKAVINDAGIPFTGHTEYLADKTDTPRVVMMLATASLKVALATTHLPLKAVAASITKDLLLEVLSILHQDLQKKFGLANPRILVCGLNPHAGESGHLGTEEIETITPVINTLRSKGMEVSGPYPADTLFNPRQLAQGDAVLAMYHDQGLPVLKSQGFGEAVNITLGLPIIRTSVDHGTALDLAGTGRAESGSLQAAIDFAHEMASTPNRGSGSR